MTKARLIAAFLLAALVAATATAVRAGQAPIQASLQSRDPSSSTDEPRKAAEARWQAARDRAERKVREGDYVGALQCYLEYACRAEEMGRPGLVAWGKNNAAHMIIRLHIEDPSFDLEPARKLIEEALAIAGSTAACREALAKNLDYVNSFLR